MANNQELYELIKSLDSKEKRYLKLLMKALSGPKQKRYQKHFDAIVAMKKYDDLIWKRSMGLKITTRQIKETNNYLYDFILKGLMLYSNPKDKSKNRVLVDAQKINTLMEKGLYTTAAKKINELIQLAEEQQFYDLSLHLLNEKRSIHFGTGLLKSDPQLMPNILDNFDSNIIHAQNINDYLRFLQKAKEVLEKWTTIRDAEVESKYIELLKNDLMKSDEKATCPRSKNLYFILKLALLTNLRSEEECMQECDKAIAYFTNEANTLSAFYIGFMLNKKMEICTIFKEYKLLNETLKIFNSNSGKAKNHSEQFYWFIMSIRHQLNAFYAFQKVKEFNLLIEDIDTEKYESSSITYPTVYIECEFTKAKIYHLNGQFNEALECLDKVLDTGKNIRLDLKIAARILFLIIHYELGNQLYLPYAIQSLYRAILKTNSSHLAERELLTFLRQAIQVKDAADLKALQQNLLSSWQKMMDDKYQKDFFFFFPYCEWIESQISGKSFTAV